jgi:hypothetical protein
MAMLNHTLTYTDQDKSTVFLGQTWERWLSISQTLANLGHPSQKKKNKFSCFLYIIKWNE